MVDAYIGSCNAGWTSLSQVKELGVLVQNAADIVSDVLKIWEQYWSIAQTNVLPPQWPAEYVIPPMCSADAFSRWDTAYNVDSPGNTMINGTLGYTVRSFTCRSARTVVHCRNTGAHVPLSSHMGSHCYPGSYGSS